MRYCLALLLLVSPVLADTQTKSPASAVDDGDWNNPTNVFASDNVDATNSGTTLDWLDATNFGFTVPDGATVDSIIVSVEGTAGSAASDLARTQLIKAGSRTGFGVSEDLEESFTCFTDDITIFTAANLWGGTFSPAEVNSSNFGASLRKNNSSSDCMTVDHIQIEVIYTPEVVASPSQIIWIK